MEKKISGRDAAGILLVVRYFLVKLSTLRMNPLAGLPRLDFNNSYDPTIL